MPSTSSNERATKKKKKSSSSSKTTATTTELSLKKKKKKTSKSSKKPKHEQYTKLPSSTTNTTTTQQEQQTTEKPSTSTSYSSTIQTSKLLHYQTQLTQTYTQIRNALPHPTRTYNTPSHRHLFTTAAIILTAFTLFYSYDTLLLDTYTTSSFVLRGGGGTRDEYSLAYQQSYGFFNNIPEEDWMRMKERVKSVEHYNDGKKGLRSQFLDRNDARTWYQNNWNQDFTCPHELRVGGTGDGPKWVCDPHRLTEYYTTHLDEKCLIYSVGSNIFQNNNNNNNNNHPFSFELGMQEVLGSKTLCEIHVFDPYYVEGGSDEGGTNIPEGIIMHPWGIEGSKDIIKGRTNYMTLSETLHHLSHDNNSQKSTTTIDILKMDCEECEWNAYQDWFFSPSSSGSVKINQILVELHGTPKNDVHFFEEMRENGYVIFHKEADTQYGGIWQEYGFLRLAPEFFE